MRTRGEQVTIARSVTKEGIGLHTGERCRATLVPAEANAGIVFVLGEGEVVPATSDHAVRGERGTGLGRGEARVGSVEHVLAALYGMQVDNVRVEVEGPEVPACDGSAREWVAALREAGRRRQGEPREVRRLGEAVWAGSGDAWAVAAPGNGGLSLAVGVEYEGTAAGRQGLWMRLSRGEFMRELAPARTFALEEEVEALRARGLARGGSADNAFAVGADSYSGPLRFADEVVRHKMLDLVGDLALCGERFEGQVTAVRPSHRLNVELAGALRARFLGEGE
jgi:UDP-3-O-[3-hydroxymyristoyl] N-acetylglucosamine deacetylase